MSEAPDSDRRLYLRDADTWQVKVRAKGKRLFCYQKAAGEDWHHQIGVGEIYVQKGEERLCLNCAIRHYAVTTDRLHWQHRGPMPDGSSQEKRPIV